jgi:hypothetical protein
MKYFFVIICLLITSVTSAQNLLSPTGAVGIGTTTPSALLHVNQGNIKLTNPTDYPFGINIDVNFPGTWVREFSLSFNGTGKVASFGAYATGGTLGYAYIGGNTTSTAAYSSPWMTFMPNGNIGIGTVTPSNRLTIETTDSLQSNMIKMENKGVTNSNFYLGTANSTFPVNTFRNQNVIESYKNLHISAATASGNLYFETGRFSVDAPVRMIINSAGNVGIGTVTPGPYKLAVEGTIGARKIKVTQVTPWADFVFDDAYQLPSIQEVELFIKSNKHLPDMPSAKEVAVDGIDLAEMNQKLLQKVEEQMLYIIEMNKQIANLTEQVGILKAKAAAVNCDSLSSLGQACTGRSGGNTRQ